MKKTIAFITILFMPFYLVYGETVHLKDGSVINGNVKNATSEKISLETSSGTLDIKKSEIEKIDYTVTPVKEDAKSNEAPLASEAPAAPRQRYSSELILKAGYDFEGSHDVTDAQACIGSFCANFQDGSEDTTSGYSIAGEAYVYPNSVVGLGVGIAAQTPRKQKDFDGDFYFVPVYGSIKLRTDPRDKNTYLYAIGQLGFNGYFGDSTYKGAGGELTGGLYAGVGAGACVNNLIIEFLYTENNGSVEQSVYVPSLLSVVDITADITYTKATLSVGYRFSFK
jgi:hypothetical protein